MTAQHSDESLMLSYCDGDLLAFKELYRRHSGGLYRFIAWRSPRREWVDEIAQDSWAALHAARARYEPTAGFRTYLYQIARNRLVDLLRQKEAKLACDFGNDCEGDAAFDRVADAAQEVSSPELELEKKQQIATLHAAIRVLPNDQKEALVLQQFNGMSLEEIAELTEVPLETVKSRLRYAMKKLRSQLQSLTAQGEVA
jgi:RNA polymerase sigma factor (sigma-70 family)